MLHWGKSCVSFARRWWGGWSSGCSPAILGFIEKNI